MLDKNIIKSKFRKSIKTYSDNAPVQLYMAHKLAKYVTKDYKNILEIGSYSGFLTKEIIKKVNFENYLALDIVDSYEYIKNLSPKIKFTVADIEQIELKEKYDLIISSSSLQWCNNLKAVIKKLKSYLSPEGHIMIAIFGKKNLYEIKEAFGISLDYPDISDIKQLFCDNAIIFEEIKTLEFSSSHELLRHLKYTGVNSFKNKLTYSQIKEKMKILEEKFQNKLTYNPLYIID